jgi:hypothetical protein
MPAVANRVFRFLSDSLRTPSPGGRGMASDAWRSAMNDRDEIETESPLAGPWRPSGYSSPAWLAGPSFIPCAGISRGRFRSFASSATSSRFGEEC